MKLKEGLDLVIDDFYYELTDGGRLNPEDVLESAADAKRVRAAIEVLREFEDACDDAGIMM